MEFNSGFKGLIKASCICPEGKSVRVHAVKAYGGTGAIAPLIFYLTTK